MTALNILTNYFADQGYTFPEIGLLQPADPFLETAGEDLRRRIFITTENSGKILCLRPEFTIPVCLQHLCKDTTRGQYAYAGTVFRQRSVEHAEFIQAGIESFGESDFDEADINCIATAIEAAKQVGQQELHLVLGDQKIFAELLTVLEIPQSWCKKLLRGFGDAQIIQKHLQTMSGGSRSMLEDLPEDLKFCLEKNDRQAVVNWLSDQMLGDGLPLTGSRTPEAIAERLVETTELASVRLDETARRILETFLGLDTDLADAADTVRQFEKDNDIVLKDAANSLAFRFERLKDTTLTMRYRAGFGRRLDYYTGFVFELFNANGKNPIVGGGRYDQLMTLLGARTTIPAVGFSIWVDRLDGPGAGEAR